LGERRGVAGLEAGREVPEKYYAVVLDDNDLGWRRRG
jgi:hypothetical protein